MGKCSAADGLEEEENDDEEKENEEDDGLELSVSDTKLMAGLLETIVILWEGIHLKLKKVCVRQGNYFPNLTFITQVFGEWRSPPPQLNSSQNK